MLLRTDKSLGRWDCGAPAGRKDVSDTLYTLIDRMRHLGFEVPPLYGSRNNVAGGVPLRLAVAQLLRSPARFEKAGSEIRSLLREEIPFTLSLSDLGQGDAAIHAMQRVSEFLQAEIGSSGHSGERVGISIHARQIPLQAFQVFTDTVPGGGPRYVLLDDSQMTPPGDKQLHGKSDKTWSLLWRNRKSPAPLRPAYGAMIRTACPLLVDEVAASVLPVHGIQVPADSAWMPIGLSLPRFADAAGEISWDRLLPALAGGVDLADKFMERLHWPHSSQQTDARLNRRLAISVTGLGDVVLRRGLDPQDLDTLRWLTAIITRIRKKLWHCSGELARINGCLPALHKNDPSSGWDDSTHRENWRHVWQRALQQSAVRHRNMLVLSPYTVLPSADNCAVAYTDLLPAIASADAWSFADVPQTQFWNLSEYISFHRRAWAVIQGRKTGTLVAAGV